MAEQTETIFLDVHFDTDKVARQLASVTQGLAAMQQQQAGLTKDMKKANEVDAEKVKTLAELNMRIAAATAEQKSLQGQLQQTMTANNGLGDSFREMDAQLRQLENQYKSLTKAQRNTEEGQALKDAIIEQKQALKEFDEELGNFQRNVGNYTNSIIAASGSLSHDFNDALKAAGVGSSVFGKGIDGLDKSMKLASRNPFMAVLSLLLPLIMKLTKALFGSEEAMAQVKQITDQLKEAFKQIEPILRKVAGVATKVLAKAFEVVTKAITEVLEGIDWLANKLGINLHLADAFKSVGEAANDMAGDVKTADERIVKSGQTTADKLAEIQKLLRKRKQTELQNELDDLKEKERQELATERLTLGEKLEIQEWYKKEEARIRKEYADKEQKEREEAARKTLDLYGELQQSQLDLMKDGYDKRMAAENLRYEQERIKLQRRLDDDNALTEKQRGILLQLLENLQKEHNAKIGIIDDEYYKDKKSKEEADTQRQKEKEKKLREEYKKSREEMVSALASSFSAMADLLDEWAEENEAAAAAAKGFALVGIITNQAQAIASGVAATMEALKGANEAAAGTGILAPITQPIYMAQMVGTVAGMIASVIGGISEAKQVLSTAKYAEGGIIGGTSYAGDKMIARVNSGEMILNGQQQARLFEIANTGAGAMSYDAMAAAMAAAVKQIPAPVMVYDEFKKFQKQTATYNEIVRV